MLVCSACHLFTSSLYSQVFTPAALLQVRFGHAPTSGFTRLQATGSSLGIGRGALDSGLSPNMSPTMSGPSNLEIARALGRSPGGMTPGMSGSLSALGVLLKPYDRT